jgi:AcrR family transcriptional regulator
LLLAFFPVRSLLAASMADKVSTKTPVQTRRAEEKEQRRQTILDAAERVIAKKGWDNTNFGEIAQRTRLSRSLVYFYFPTRDDLFHAVCDRGMEDLERRFRAAMGRHPTGIDQLMALGRAYHAFSVEEPLYFSLLSQSQAKQRNSDEKSPAEESSDTHGRNCLELVAQALGNGVADGTIRKGIGDPRPSAVAIWAFTHGLIQISAREATMLKQDFQLTSKQMLDHGFNLLRDSLSTG